MFLSLETFNVHHKDWLTYSGGSDWPGELCYNFCISNDLTQIVNFPIWIPDCDFHSLALLDLFLFSDVIICSTMTFPPLGNSDHVVVTVSIDFPSNSQENALFHCIAYDYSCADWDSLYDHLRYVPLEDILNLVIMLLLVKYILLGNIRSSLTHLHGFQMLVLLP